MSDLKTAGGPISDTAITASSAPRPAPFRPRPGASLLGRIERHRVDVSRSVVVLAVEATETVRVYGLEERVNESHRVAAGEGLVWVAPEASTETLQELHAALGAEIARRATEGA